MGSEQAGLEALKAKMSAQQKKDMAEIIAKELKNREAAKKKGAMATTQVPSKKKSAVKSSAMSGGMSHDQVKELYADVNDAVKKLRLEKMDRELAKVRGVKQKMTKQTDRVAPRSWFKMPTRPAVLSERPEGNAEMGEGTPKRNVLLMMGIVIFGSAKILFSTGLVDASTTQGILPETSRVQSEAVSNDTAKNESAPVATTEETSAPASASAAASASSQNGSWTPVEKDLLTQLDARRVELEQRREALDRRESDVKNQAQALAERLSELRSLTSKLAAARKEKDQRYEARMEQLANVYGSMAPNEAAPLIGRLDDEVALALLERMPGKRMGQILSLMEQERAIELTKSLTDKKKLSE